MPFFTEQSFTNIFQLLPFSDQASKIILRFPHRLYDNIRAAGEFILNTIFYGIWLHTPYTIFFKTMDSRTQTDPQFFDLSFVIVSMLAFISGQQSASSQCC